MGGESSTVPFHANHLPADFYEYDHGAEREMLSRIMAGDALHVDGVEISAPPVHFGGDKVHPVDPWCRHPQDDEKSRELYHEEARRREAISKGQREAHERRRQREREEKAWLQPELLREIDGDRRGQLARLFYAHREHYMLLISWRSGQCTAFEYQDRLRALGGYPAYFFRAKGD